MVSRYKKKIKQHLIKEESNIIYINIYFKFKAVFAFLSLPFQSITSDYC